MALKKKGKKDNIILIGMPGAGKSTVGVILAKQTSRAFLDTDVLIQTSERRTLQEIVDTGGHIALLDIEERLMLGLSVRNHVIATGGSAVYRSAAMNHMKSLGIILFLDVDLPALQGRVHDFHTRGLAKRPGQTFSDLFEERLPLYRKYADMTIDCTNLTHEEICDRICTALVV